jgi:DNA-binding transcriptional ArsR family regulator
MSKEIGLDNIEVYIKALHCPIRWDIIKILRDEPKTSDQIYRILKNAQKLQSGSLETPHEEKCNGMCLHANHKNLKKPTLYYHLRELEGAGIIEGKKLIDEKGNKLKKKQWELTLKSLTVKLKED